MEREEITDVELSDGLEDLVAVFRGEVHLDVVGWWRAGRLLDAARARAGEVLDKAIAGMETQDERCERLQLDLERSLARAARPRRVRVEKRAAS